MPLFLEIGSVGSQSIVRESHGYTYGQGNKEIRDLADSGVDKLVK
jgi:hypothetical protein